MPLSSFLTSHHLYCHDYASLGEMMILVSLMELVGMKLNQLENNLIPTKLGFMQLNWQIIKLIM